MHRLMLTSRAYQMASIDIAANVAIDPENRLFWRVPRVAARGGDHSRRDAGRRRHARSHDRRPVVFPYIDPDLFEASSKRNWPGKPDDDPSTWRRSLYVFSKRSIRYPMFETFDQPNLINSGDRRNRSTIAPQALLLMNNGMVLLQAKKFAERLQAGSRRRIAAEQVDRAFRLALARPPDAVERQPALEFVNAQSRRLDRVLPRAVQLERVRVPPMSRHHHCHDGCGTVEKLLYSRRELLGSLGGGIAGLAFADLLGRQGLLSAPLAAQQAPRATRSRRSRSTFPPRPRRSSPIFCYGGVSQVDTFDPKPDLAEVPGRDDAGRRRGADDHGQPGRADAVAVDVQEVRPVAGWTSRSCSRTSPSTSTTSRSSGRCTRSSPAHGPALFQMNTGSILAGHPSVGSWVTYGLGSENENLPGLHRLHRLSRRADQRPAELGQRLHAGGLPGHAVPRHRHADRRSQAAGRAHAGPAARVARLLHDLNEKHARSEPARHRAVGAHPLVRAGVPDADARAGRDRHQQGDRRDAEALRRRREADGLLRPPGC